MFQYAHDNHAHDDFNRSLYRLKQSAYILKLKKLFQTYINDCSVCQLSKSFRKLPYGQLHPIEIFNELLIELSMNFIMKLLITSNDFNCFFTITDRFFKYVKLIFDRENWGVKKWADQYHRHIYSFWKLSARIIFDRDSRYISDFWITLFQKSNVKLDMTAAFHALVNDQTKRINQTIEIVIRCLFIEHYEKNWSFFIFEIEYALNISENAFIDATLFEVLYEIKSRKRLIALTISFKNDKNVLFFIERRTELRKKIHDAIKLAQTKMTIDFDKKHKSFNLIESIYIKLAKIERSNYHIFYASSLSAKKIKSFKIKQKVNELIYQLDLLKTMKIHNVIFVIYLKQALSNFYVRIVSSLSSLSVDDDKLYVVEKIIRREQRGRESKYRVKWKNYEEITWKSKNRFIKNISNIIIRFEKIRSI